MATPEQLQQIRNAIAEETRLIAELQAKKAASTTTTSTSLPVTNTEEPLQIGGAGNTFFSKQGLYDIATGGLKALTGLADVITTPAVAIARSGGINVPYFGASQMLEQDLAALAPMIGVKEKTPLQEFTSFVAPVSKGNLIRNALTGATMYAGKEAGEALVPTSPTFQIGTTLAAPLALLLGRKGGQAAKTLGAKLAEVPPTLEEETQTLVKAIDSDVAKLSTQPIEPPSRTAVTSGAAQVRNIEKAKGDMRTAANAAFKDKEVFTAPVDTTGVQAGVDSIVADWSATNKAEIPSALNKHINKLIAFEKPQMGSALAAFVPESMQSTTTTLGDLHELQKQVGKLLPKASADILTPEQTLAYRIYNYIGDIIDTTPGGEKVRKAKQAWKDYRDAFIYNPNLKQRSPLAGAQRKESEDITDYFLGGSSRFEALQKGGVDITPLQNQLVNTFLNLDSPAKKLKWINDNRPQLQTAPFWPIFENAFTVIDEQLKKKAPVIAAPTQAETLMKAAAVTGAGIVSPVLGTTLGTALLLKNLPKQTWGNILTAVGSPFAQLPDISLSNALTRGGIAAGQVSESPTAPTNKQTTKRQIDDAINNIEKQIEAKIKAKSAQPSSVAAKPTQVSALIKNQPPLIRAIIDVESKGKPAAKSGKGATGLMQLLPSTAAALGVDPKDPAQNIEGGTKYLAQMKEQFKNDKLALAAYNWGPGNLQKAINKTQKAGLKATWENILRTTFVPKETRQYVNKVLTLKNKYSV